MYVLCTLWWKWNWTQIWFTESWAYMYYRACIEFSIYLHFEQNKVFFTLFNSNLHEFFCYIEMVAFFTLVGTVSPSSSAARQQVFQIGFFLQLAEGLNVEMLCRNPEIASSLFYTFWQKTNILKASKMKIQNLKKKIECIYFFLSYTWNVEPFRAPVHRSKNWQNHNF